MEILQVSIDTMEFFHEFLETAPWSIVDVVFLTAKARINSIEKKKAIFLAPLRWTERYFRGQSDCKSWVKSVSTAADFSEECQN